MAEYSVERTVNEVYKEVFLVSADSPEEARKLVESNVYGNHMRLDNVKESEYFDYEIIELRRQDADRVA